MLCSMPRNGYCIFTLWLGRGNFGLFQSLTSQASGVPSSGYFLASLVLLAQARSFSLPWLWRSCSRYPSAIFLRWQLLVWDQRKWDLQERGWSGSVEEGLLHFGSKPQEVELGRESTCRSSSPAASSAVERRSTPETHQIFSCCPNCCVKLLFIFYFFPWDRHWCHLPPRGMSQYFFPRILGFCSSVPAGGVRINIWQFNI